MVNGVCGRECKVLNKVVQSPCSRGARCCRGSEGFRHDLVKPALKNYEVGDLNMCKNRVVACFSISSVTLKVNAAV